MDETKVVVTYAKRAGVIQREGNKWVLPMKKETQTFDNMLALMKYLEENPKVLVAVKKATVRACIINPFLSAEEKEE